jgi:hypothetical protein
MDYESENCYSVASRQRRGAERRRSRNVSNTVLIIRLIDSMKSKTKLREPKLREQGELLPLRHFANVNARDLRNLERLKNFWSLFVGSGHSRLTHPISIRHDLLLIGCHDISVLKALRASAQDTWPGLCERINTMLKTNLRRIDIVPSDPEPEPARQVQARTDEVDDPLDAVLRFYSGLTFRS